MQNVHPSRLSRSSRLQLETLEDRLVPAPATGSVELALLGRYDTGLPTTNAEISAYDPVTQRLFVSNSTAKTIDIVSIQNPASPQKISTINLATEPAAQGGSSNSVAFKNGVLAVAVENGVKTNPGRVLFYNASGTLLNQVTVGALPDMVVFTPDGNKVLVANEGAPNDAYTIDPEGSVSVIDLSAGVANAAVSTIGFTAFNSGGPRSGELSPQIRIFGPNASVAQDLEPEYITVSADGITAWVTLQENNALAVVNLNTNTITSLVPLGTKNYAESSLQTYTFNVGSELAGTTPAGQSVPLGGFSGLFFEGYADNGNLKFITNTDRGPNGANNGLDRPFLVPNFNPQLIRFQLNPGTGVITITQKIALKDATGRLLTGLPNINIPGAVEATPVNDENPKDVFGNDLPLDPLGGDFEGIVVAPDGTFWLPDEYRPAIYHFDTDGTLIQRYVPAGTAAAAGQVAGTFGLEVLPGVLSQRRLNRGFEAIAYQDGKVYTFVQSPIRNPTTLTNATLNGLKNIRIVELDPATNTTKQYVYIMDNPNLGASPNTRADKIGDAVAIGNGQFLVIERDDDAIDSDVLNTIEKKVYRFNLSGATDISNFPDLISVGGIPTSIEQMTREELVAAGITPIKKILQVDLAAAGYNMVEKIEGLALVSEDTIAVINDNDFTVGDITIDPMTGLFTRNTPAEDIILGIIRTPNAMDPSDRDGGIRINPQPVLGMYQPDAIASFQIGGQTYLITANEGKSRAYTGFNEEVRIGSLTLDPTAFPNAADLQNNALLGRLKVTNTLGDTDADLDYEKLYTFGTRSFSIWTSSGTQVYDSGADLERITAAQLPALFNSNYTNNSFVFDDRSDDKGPEPEGVTVGIISGKTYAFVGLERIGGVMVYDISSPINPVFVQYINTTAPNGTVVADPDVGPEGMLFISAADSPTGRPLVITSNEVSSTVVIFGVLESELVVNLPTGSAGNQVTLKSMGSDLVVIDDVSARVLLRQDLSATNSLTINGVIAESEMLTIDFRGTTFSLPGGVTYNAGMGDRLRIYGTAGDDQIAVNGVNLSFNGMLNVTATGLSGLSLWSGLGNDFLSLAGKPVNSANPGVELFGGDGGDIYKLNTTQTAIRILDTSGLDRIDFSESLVGVNVDIGTGAIQSIDSLGNSLAIQGLIEDLLGSNFGDILIGNATINIIWGYNGNDFINGKSGNDVLVGGDGSDTLLGEAGRDILIGGIGLDVLFGGDGDDLLVGGTTTHDNDYMGQRLMLAEWGSNRTYTQRVQNLLYGFGSVTRSNGSILLSAVNVDDDQTPDSFIGGFNRDWFVNFPGDGIQDKATDELSNF